MLLQIKIKSTKTVVHTVNMAVIPVYPVTTVKWTDTITFSHDLWQLSLYEVKRNESHTLPL